MSVARDHALAELDRRRLPGWKANVLRSKNVPEPQGRDRGLSNQIVIGVIKNLLHLRWLMEEFSGRSLKSIEPLVQKILAIGLYQIRFLDRIPASAAVDEAVEQTKRFGQKRAAGFVNAVLRKAARGPMPKGPDRNSQSEEYARVMLSHPPELYRKLGQLVGREEALAICEHDNREPPTIVRLISGKLESEGVKIIAHEREGMFVVKGASVDVLADWARRGIAQVQDPTAAEVVAKLGIEKGEAVLDRCCGLGTKTIQMRQAVGEQGSVVAIDPSEERCEVLQRIVLERNVKNVTVRRARMLEEGMKFSKILVDAPCSNSGVLARRPEARYAQDEKTLASLARLQDRILDDSAPALMSGGRMVYSTCSIWAQENSERVKSFLGRHPDYRLVAEKLTFPSVDDVPVKYHDGGYFAVLERH
ncbi:MAG TPA: transcription antitermination factor NusB [Tepidisphaeraceae bacterium]|nr:transcription antitermination factor NusB [Tepidisphaeraceae bacterium]